MAQKKPGLIGRRRDGEAVCLSRGTGCGEQWPQVEACSKTVMLGDTAPCWREEEEPWDGSDLTVVFHR